MEKQNEENPKRAESASKKKKPKSKPADKNEEQESEKLRKAQIEFKIRERVASEARAFDVVNRLIEPNITEEFLLGACQFIDQSHYMDVVEERSISHLCGYPLCNNALRQMAKKRYHISTKSNTVYDITERKKFCSNLCYHASEHLRKQIPQTPVWTRRGENSECFDLLQHNANSHLEGEVVVGSKTSGLKEEVLLLEKLDKMDEKAAKARKAKPAKPDHASVEESQRLSDQLQSLSTEEDLHTSMGKLSLCTDSGEGKHSAGTEASAGANAHGIRPTDTESKEERQKRQACVENCQYRQPGCEEVEKEVDFIQSGSLKLESCMKKLTLQDSSNLVGIDSNDDHAENVVEKTEVDKNQQPDGFCESQDAAVSQTPEPPPNPVGADSDDDEDDVTKPPNPVVADSDDDEDIVTKPPSLSKPQNSALSRTCADLPGSVKADSKATGETVIDNCKQDEKPLNSDLKQQPGESKAAYLMRLLDRRKNLLSKVADIQSDLPQVSRKPESNPNSFTDSIQTVRKADGTKLPKPEKKESIVEENEHFKDSSEKVQQKEKSSLNPKPNRPSRQKKGAQVCKESHTKTTQAEVSPLSFICQIISSWISVETLDYLRLNPMQKEANEDVREDSTGSFHTDPEIQRKYQDLCQRLAGQERDFDDVLGEEEVEADGDRRGGKKPLPNYELLKEETEEYQLKVQQFMAGSMKIKSKPIKVKSDTEAGDEADNDRPVVLPDIDSHNQMLIRRRIVLERLDRTMLNLLPPLGLSVQDISASLRELVFTFSLTSHNIVFKPVEWTLAAIILLKMMEIKCEAVNAAFQSSSRSAAFNMVLSRLDHSSTSLALLVQDMLTQCKHSLQQQASQTHVQ